MMKILIVDDDKNISSLLKMAFEMVSKDEVHLCYRGDEALEILSHETFDIVLVDYFLAQKDGLTVFREHQAAQIAHSPFIFISGNSDRKLEELTLKEGALGYIHKPFDPVVVVNQIHQLVKAKGAA